MLPGFLRALCGAEGPIISLEGYNRTARPLLSSLVSRSAWDLVVSR